MSGDEAPSAARERRSVRSMAGVSAKAIEHGRSFVASLFMAVRTAQIHDPSNQAFEHAIQALSKAAEALFQVTGGFSIRFVDDSVFLNGTRLRFEGGTYSSAQTLRRMLASKRLGGLELQRAPSPAAVRKLVMLFAPHAHEDPKASAEALFGEIQVLGVQRFQDKRSDVRIDRRVMVVQSYGKLILALRERIDRARARRSTGAHLGPPRLKPVRVVQDLVELCGDRTDFLLRLSNNRRGAPIHELFGVNTCLLSVVMGHAVGLSRPDVVDVGLAALLIPLGATDLDADGPRETFDLDATSAEAAAVRLLSDSGISLSTYLRCVVLGEQCGLSPLDLGAPAHPYAELVRCAAAYQQLVLGLGEPEPLHPLSALARLHNGRAPGIDRRWVDLMINVLRAFPKGSVVILDDGTTAEVSSQIGGSRWDRPVVKVPGSPPGVLDLMIREDGRFVQRIRSTAYYAGAAPAPLAALIEEPVAPDGRFDAAFPDRILPTDDEHDTATVTPHGEADAEPLQLPLLTESDLAALTVDDTDVSAYALAELTETSPAPVAHPGDEVVVDALRAFHDNDDDFFESGDGFDITQADPFDPTKTQESFAAVTWDE